MQIHATLEMARERERLARHLTAGRPLRELDPATRIVVRRLRREAARIRRIVKRGA